MLNIVNTTGEYVLGRSVVEHASTLAARQADFDVEAFIGGFYGSFFFWVNIATICIQAFLVSRIVKHLGMAGALFALPIVALGTYSLVAAGAGFAVLRAAKLAGVEVAVKKSPNGFYFGLMTPKRRSKRGRPRKAAKSS